MPTALPRCEACAPEPVSPCCAPSLELDFPLTGSRQAVRCSGDIASASCLRHVVLTVSHRMTGRRRRRADRTRVRPSFRPAPEPRQRALAGRIRTPQDDRAAAAAPVSGRLSATTRTIATGGAPRTDGDRAATTRACGPTGADRASRRPRVTALGPPRAMDPGTARLTGRPSRSVRLRAHIHSERAKKDCPSRRQTVMGRWRGRTRYTRCARPHGVEVADRLPVSCIAIHNTACGLANALAQAIPERGIFQGQVYDPARGRPIASLRPAGVPQGVF